MPPYECRRGHHPSSARCQGGPRDVLLPSLIFLDEPDARGPTATMSRSARPLNNLLPENHRSSAEQGGREAKPSAPPWLTWLAWPLTEEGSYGSAVERLGGFRGSGGPDHSHTSAVVGWHAARQDCDVVAVGYIFSTISTHPDLPT